MTFKPPTPVNEPVRTYVPGSPERQRLLGTIAEMSAATADLASIVDGREIRSGATFEVRAPHRRDLLLALVHEAQDDTVRAAIESALAAKQAWETTAPADRAAVFLRAAELLAGPFRDRINAATMLGQSKTIHQAEIDSACELIDFLRFNVSFYADILAEQPPANDPGIWNQLDYRPLEGFVLAVTPFNFTAIAGNLPTAPALCGNVVVWKPSEKQALAANLIMDVLHAAGLPPGVINLVHGDGARISRICLDDANFAGLHFTGSSSVFRSLWQEIGARIDAYRTYPRLVGETGGKDFVLVHPSATVDAVVTGLVRGAFEYQGQKCSAASRAYVPASLWPEIRVGLRRAVDDIVVGDVSDPTVFMGAVIDERAYRRLVGWIDRLDVDPGAELVAGGWHDETQGWFVGPSVFRLDDPHHDVMATELFGPLLAIHVYDDSDWDAILDVVDTTSPYGLTGAVFATDRSAIETASRRLRNAAGNFYINDKPTGAVVGQQPFGGSRASGTNDKAGARHNLARWCSPRSVKETMVSPTTWGYPSMSPDAG